MEEKTKRAVRAGVILAFIIVVIGLLIYSRIVAYSMAPFNQNPLIYAHSHYGRFP
jgi:hypothetical protein